MLDIASDGDVQFDEELYKHLQAAHGAGLRHKIFFFIDNRNVIGKDIPFQLDFLQRYGVPLFGRSLVIAHDVDDFSRIWQAMGRSRTMNDTTFTIYKAGIAPADESLTPRDLRSQPLSRALYVRNCERKVAGNLSSIYQTLLALYNLAEDRFYYPGEIANVFIDKMQRTIGAKVAKHLAGITRHVLGAPPTAAILGHILGAKFRRAPSADVRAMGAPPLAPPLVQALLGHIVEQKFELRSPSADLHDRLLLYLCGEQAGSAMEVSYTEQPLG